LFFLYPLNRNQIPAMVNSMLSAIMIGLDAIVAPADPNMNSNSALI